MGSRYKTVGNTVVSETNFKLCPDKKKIIFMHIKQHNIDIDISVMG